MDWTQILLSIIAILSMVASAVIAGVKGKRDRSNNKEDRLFDFMKEQMDKQDKQMQSLQDRMISKKEFVKRSEFEVQNNEMKKNIDEIKNNINKFSRLSVAVDCAILKSIEGLKPNGELHKAKELIEEYTLNK